MQFITIIRNIRKRFLKHTPLISVRISQSKLLHNLHYYQRTYPKLQIAPVLKSNAYGHGLIEVAHVLDSEQLPFFVLDSLPEAMLLRNARVRTPILILGYTTPENIVATRGRDISFTITSLAQLETLAQLVTRPLRIHLKIDTGMHRQGIQEEELPKALQLISHTHYLFLEGICSHFADADTAASTLTAAQKVVWERCVKLCTTAFPVIPFIHISATAGADESTTTTGNLIRLGLGLYGIDPSPKNVADVQPVLTIETVLSSVKKIHTGDTVGYNGTFTAEKETRIATIPMGYYEGIDRRLSNTGYVCVRNVTCPIIGRVSMNITSIDVSGVPDVTLNEPVTVISGTTSDKNSVVQHARHAQTIPWEILVHIPASLRRVVID